MTWTRLGNQWLNNWSFTVTCKVHYKWKHLATFSLFTFPNSSKWHMLIQAARVWKIQFQLKLCHGQPRDTNILTNFSHGGSATGFAIFEKLIIIIINPSEFLCLTILWATRHAGITGRFNFNILRKCTCRWSYTEQFPYTIAKTTDNPWNESKIHNCLSLN